MISPHHAKLYRDYYSARGPLMHRRPKWADFIENYTAMHGLNSILDYGSGPEQCLWRALGDRVTSYDPGCPGIDVWHRRAFDFVVCLHTLEHCEPAFLDGTIEAVMLHMQRAALIVVSTKPSTKVLPDGSPWHSCVHEHDWWRNKLTKERPGQEIAPLAPDEVAVLFER